MQIRGQRRRRYHRAGKGNSISPRANFFMSTIQFALFRGILRNRDCLTTKKGFLNKPTPTAATVCTPTTQPMSRSNETASSPRAQHLFSINQTCQEGILLGPRPRHNFQHLSTPMVAYVQRATALGSALTVIFWQWGLALPGPLSCWILL